MLSNVMLHRQELIRSQFSAVCKDPRFEKSKPFCQKCARHFLSKHHGEVLVNLQKNTHFLYLCNLKVYTSNDKSLNVKKLSFLPSQ